MELQAKNDTENAVSFLESLQAAHDAENTTAMNEASIGVEEIMEVTLDRNNWEEKESYMDMLREVFLYGDMPRSQKYINSGIKAAGTGSFKYIHILCLYIPNIMLRGISQVFLCNHPITGALISVGLCLSSPHLMGHALMGSAVGSLGAAVMGGIELSQIESGLAGYDATLASCACFVFLDDSDLSRRYLVAACLSFMCGAVHTICSNFMNSVYSLPALTLAFNLVCLSFLGGIETENIGVISLKDASDGTSADTSMSLLFMVDATLRGVGQFIFVDTTLEGVFVVIGIAVASRSAAFSVLVGSGLACLVSLYVIEVPAELNESVRNGLYGYNAAGVYAAIAGNVFYLSTKESMVFGIAGTCLSFLVLVFFKFFLNGLPVLTLPFCVTTWLVMYLRTPSLIPLDQNETQAKHTVQAIVQSTFLDSSMHSSVQDSSMHSMRSELHGR